MENEDPATPELEPVTNSVTAGGGQEGPGRDDSDISCAMNYASMRDNSLRLASLDDTISSSSRTPPRALNPSASAFVPSPTSTAPIRPGKLNSENWPAIRRNSAVTGPDENESDDTVPDLGSNGEPLRARQTATPSTFQRTVSVDALGRDGPMTPRNTAGPFVLDGSAGDDDEAVDGHA